MLGSKKKELTYTYHKTGIKLAFVWQGVFRANVKFCVFRSDKLKFALSLIIDSFTSNQKLSLIQTSTI
jgi:hypothetical protein